jgi:hypothetical protein
VRFANQDWKVEDSVREGYIHSDLRLPVDPKLKFRGVFKIDFEGCTDLVKLLVAHASKCFCGIVLGTFSSTQEHSSAETLNLQAAFNVLPGKHTLIGDFSGSEFRVASPQGPPQPSSHRR